MRWVLPSILATALPLSGCFADSSEPPSGTTTTTSSNVSQGPGNMLGPDDVPASGYPTAIRFTECTGFVTTANYPEGTLGAQQDPNWQAPGGIPVDRYDINLYDCARISVGPFERPLRLITESHNYANPPESCYPEVPSGGLVRMAVLSSIWVNDAEVADWLKATYDLPSHFSEITEAQTPQPGFLERAWSWGIHGQERSELSFIDDDLPPDQLPESWRYFWFNQTAVKAMDVSMDNDHPGAANRYAWGTLAPPMLGANFNENYASNGDWLSEVRASATVTMFNDHFCTEPA